MYGGIHVIPGFFPPNPPKAPQINTVKSNNMTADQRTEPKTSHIADPSFIMYMCI